MDEKAYQTQEYEAGVRMLMYVYAGNLVVMLILLGMIIAYNGWPL